MFILAQTDGTLCSMKCTSCRSTHTHTGYQRPTQRGVSTTIDLAPPRLVLPPPYSSTTCNRVQHNHTPKVQQLCTTTRTITDNDITDHHLVWWWSAPLIDPSCSKKINKRTMPHRAWRSSTRALASRRAGQLPPTYTTIALIDTE